MDGFPPSEQVETLIEEGVWSLSGSQHTDRGDRKKLPPVKPELVIRTTFSGRFKTLAQGYGKSSRNWEGDWVGLAHGIQMRTSSVAGRTVRAVAVTITGWLVVSMLTVGSPAATTARAECFICSACTQPQYSLNDWVGKQPAIRNPQSAIRSGRTGSGRWQGRCYLADAQS